MKKLPTSIKDFKKIIEEGYLYVDKTADIYKLIISENYTFLSRPRRFGKSLLLSVLEQIFSDNKELFKDLAIYSMDFSWKKYPIIKIDFSELRANSIGILESKLISELNNIAKLYNITQDLGNEITEALKTLIRELSKIDKVVILIDEYDAPILRNINNLEIAEANQDVLRDFYTTIKASDQYIHKFFMTGVTKVAKTSFFSGFNNAVDISLSTEYQALLGYTQNELETYFKDYIAKIAKDGQVTVEELKEKIKHWYNGYNFASYIEKVYNPFSIARFFTENINLKPNAQIRFDNYWIETGTTSYLVYLAKKNIQNLLELNNNLNINKYVKIPAGSMVAFKPESIPFNVLLLQSGYLTIIDYNHETSEYYVYYPNAEVKRALEVDLLSALVNTEYYEINQQISIFRDCLEQNDINKIFLTFKAMMASIPYDLLEDLHKERFYHIILLIVMSNLNLRYTAEEHTDKGSIDLTVETNKFIYLFEFKLNSTPKAALKQIDNRKYYEKYLTSPKTIVLVGAAFNIKPREILFESKILK